MRRITQYDGLYGENNTQPDAEYLYSELLETRSSHFDWDIRPHIHPRLYQLFLVKHGRFSFFDASNRHQLDGPCLMLIPPAALHGFIYDAGVTGHILTLSDSLLDTIITGAELLTPMLRNVQVVTSFAAPYSPERMQALIRAVDEELFNNQPGKSLMLHACLQQLFLTIYRLWQNNTTVLSASDNRSLAYFRKFQQRVHQVGTTSSIAQLATELAITTVHLNRICKEITGKSAGQLVQEHVLEEARKYLTYTSYTISEIAYLLNFEYPNYFARFFKKHTGLSPTQFRDGRK